MPHYSSPRMLSQTVDIALIGCGGNGSQMLTGLAKLNHSITNLGHPGLHVRAFDPDTVSEANLGRQMFGSFDVGQSKAHALVNRINAFFGVNWESVFGRFATDNDRFDIVIVCVDSRKSRHEIHREMRNFKAEYLMDLGNRAADGQVLIGEVRASVDGRNRPADHVRIPHPYTTLPELIDIKQQEDDTPSCGLAEALERQELFVNQAIVTPALHILWEFFRYGQLTWHGAFVNLRTGSMRPMMVKEAA